MRDWTGLDFNSSQRAAEDSQKWQRIVADVSSDSTGNDKQYKYVSGIFIDHNPLKLYMPPWPGGELFFTGCLL